MGIIKNTEFARQLNIIYSSIRFHDFFKSHLAFVLKWYIRYARRQQAKLIHQLHQQERIKVAFFFQTPAVWKYDLLYRRLSQDKHFEPIVFLVPYNVNITYDMEETLRVLKQSEAYAKEQGYQYVSSYNAEKKMWIDIRKTWNPDVIFFAKPYKDTLPQYHLYHFMDKLTCYTPYSYYITNNYRPNTAFPFHNLLWKHFVDTQFHYDQCRKWGVNKGDNAIVSYCMTMERLMDKTYQPKDVWKPQEKPKKRIIWAPHHTVDYLFNFSNFMVYAEKMLEIAEEYKDVAQFAFKPHPVLKFRLLNCWGEKKTEEYYQRWSSMENTQLEEGEYTDLFLTSDAMIHDSCSFMIEYMHCPQKPILYTIKDKNNLYNTLNPLSTEAIEQHYHAYNEADIIRFIKDVLAGNDPMREQRERFAAQHLYPADHMLPSERVYQVLKKELL